jgi:protein required for attachment to host cells
MVGLARYAAAGRKLAMLVPNGTLVMIVDGAHRAVYRNAGEALAPHLVLVEEAHQHVPRTAELGSDRPGHHFESAGPGRGGYEETDLHQLAEDRFALEAAERLEALLQEGATQVVLVAPPHVLGVMRPHFGKLLAAALLAQIAKDYAQRTPEDIAALLVRYEP